MCDVAVDFEEGELLEEQLNILREVELVGEVGERGGFFVSEEAKNFGRVRMVGWLWSGCKLELGLRLLVGLRSSGQHVVRSERSGGVVFDEVEIAGAVGAVDVCGEGEDFTVGFEGNMGGYESARANGGFCNERGCGEAGDYPITLGEVIVLGGDIGSIFGNNGA